MAMKAQKAVPGELPVVRHSLFKGGRAGRPMTIRVSLAELQVFTAAAIKEGITLSAWARKVLRGEATVVLARFNKIPVFDDVAMREDDKGPWRDEEAS